MNSHRPVSRSALLLLASAAATGCSETPHSHDHDSGIADSGVADSALPDAGQADAEVDAALQVDAGPQQQTFTIRFRAMVGDQAASCSSTYGGFGPSGDHTVRFKDLRFYVHGIELLRADGGSEPLVVTDVSPWQRAGVALLDFEDSTHGCGNGTFEMRDVVVGTALEGDYEGIRFVLGVPFDQNHQDRSTALPPLSLSSLFWSWQGGYKFLRADVETIPMGLDAGLPATFNVHIGSTGCDGSPATGGTTACTAPNRPTIELQGFDPATSVVELDYAAILGSVDPTFNTPNSAVGCMSGPTDPECQEVLPSLGIPFGSTEPAMDAFRVGSALP